MDVLNRCEDLLEAMFEGTPMRILGARVQPAQIVKKLERTMENERMTDVDEVFVPNLYDVFLNPRDYEAYGESVPHWEGRFAAILQRRADESGWKLIIRPLQVRFISKPTVSPAQVFIGYHFGHPTTRPAPVQTQVGVSVAPKRGHSLVRWLLLLLIAGVAIFLNWPYHFFGSATEMEIEGKLYLAEWGEQVEDRRLLAPILLGYTDVPELRSIARRAAERGAHIVVGTPSPGAFASYNTVTNQITVSEKLFDEPLDVQVSILAHELRHAAGGTILKALLPRTCLQEELDAKKYEVLAYSKIIRPAGHDTRWTREMDKNLSLSKKGRLAETILLSPTYQQKCLKGVVK